MKIICEHEIAGWWTIAIDRGDDIEWRPIKLIQADKIAPIVDNLAMAYELGFNYPHPPKDES